MLKQRKVMTGSLSIGMYVASLDRPWLETPFLLQGFYIENEHDIEELAKYCDYVYIDEGFTRNVGRHNPFLKTRKRLKPAELFPNARLRSYIDSVAWEDELDVADLALGNLSDCLLEIFNRVQDGENIPGARLKRAVEPMIESMIRNPDACTWLNRVRSSGDYTFDHAMSCSVLSVAMGRHLGLPKADLRSLAMGGLLLDIGRLRLDPELLSGPRKLSDGEFAEVRRHVMISVDIIKAGGIINRDVISMVAHHHERHNGTGYPNRLALDDIPIFARIAAVVDCYHAMTTQRPHALAISPAYAIKKLYEWKDVDFQEELVDTFIQAVGMYPAASLVEMSSGEVGVVVAGYRSRRLRPNVLVLRGADRRRLRKGRMINLEAVSHTSRGEPLTIDKSLEANAYGIDVFSLGNELLESFAGL
jgi:HD-GYP domain-containing protein (c-di-GMP phosphodiesterase class II)